MYKVDTMIKTFIGLALLAGSVPLLAGCDDR